MSKSKTQTSGMQYRAGLFGKYHFRLRERHLAEHVAPLLSSRRDGAVKLDVVLRGLALLPQHAGNRTVGLVLPKITYEELHDLCRPSSVFLTTMPEDEHADPETLSKKRKWVGEQLQCLEDMNLVQRVDRPGRRPYIVVLRDDGSGEPFDDPDGKPGNSYVTVSGAVIASNWLTMWGGPEIAAYFAAMVADRFARLRDGSAPVGGATWVQPLHWFSDRDGQRPTGHVPIPFSTRTLERGFQKLSGNGLVVIERTTKNPRGGRRFTFPRSVYTNHFADLDANYQTVKDEELVKYAKGWHFAPT